MMNRPIITVMLQARTPERIFALIDRGLSDGADAFGLQVEPLERRYRTPEIFKEIFVRTHGLPVYVTDYRHRLNMGRADEELAEELLMIAEYGGDLFDVPADLFCPSRDQICYDERIVTRQKRLISALHEKGKRVLVSSHTFRYMTYDEVLFLMHSQRARGADVTKLIAAANSERENSAAFEITAMLRRELEHEFLFLCTGEFSGSHRRLAPMISGGMFLCAVEHDELSTPQQPLLSDAVKMTNLIFGDRKK